MWSDLQSYRVPSVEICSSVDTDRSTPIRSTARDTRICFPWFPSFLSIVKPSSHRAAIDSDTDGKESRNVSQHRRCLRRNFRRLNADARLKSVWSCRRATPRPFTAFLCTAVHVHVVKPDCTFVWLRVCIVLPILSGACAPGKLRSPLA
jgi:hypothetical protein